MEHHHIPAVARAVGAPQSRSSDGGGGCLTRGHGRFPYIQRIRCTFYQRDFAHGAPTRLLILPSIPMPLIHTRQSPRPVPSCHYTGTIISAILICASSTHSGPHLSPTDSRNTKIDCVLASHTAPRKRTPYRHVTEHVAYVRGLLAGAQIKLKLDNRGFSEVIDNRPNIRRSSTF